MSKVDFGVMLRQQKIEFPVIKDAAQMCDELGYHSVWFYDHLLGMGGVDLDIYESWTLMSALSALTSRVKLGTMVLCNSFRHPPLLAKMGSTLDVISEGRLDFALGAGWFEQEYIAYGYPFPDTKTRIEQLSEAVQIIKKMWTEDKTTFNGIHYSTDNTYCNPKPVQKPHPPVTVGGAGENMLLRLVAEHADCWNCPATHALEFDNKLKALEKHCDQVGRDINDITISQQTVCVIAENEKLVEEKLAKGQKRYGFFGDIEKLGIVGTPEQCIEKIRDDQKKGISKYTIFFSDVMKPDTLELFAKEVMPEFQ